jgi:hypothetical protein
VGEKCKAYFAGEEGRNPCFMLRCEFQRGWASISLWTALPGWKGGKEMKPGRERGEKVMVMTIITTKDNNNK